MAILGLDFKNLSRTTQMYIFAGLAVALCGIIYFYYFQPLLAEKTTLEQEVNTLKSEVAQGIAIASRLNQFKKEYAELEERLKVLRTILPPEKETPIVLRGVQEMASASNLKIMKFTPQPSIPRAFYSDWPIQIDVQGSFDGLGKFFERLGQSTRLINADNITIRSVESSTDSTRTLTASCTATTFVFQEEQARSAANAPQQAAR